MSDHFTSTPSVRQLAKGTPKFAGQGAAGGLFADRPKKFALIGPFDCPAATLIPLSDTAMMTEMLQRHVLLPFPILFLLLIIYLLQRTALRITARPISVADNNVAPWRGVSNVRQCDCVYKIGIERRETANSPSRAHYPWPVVP